MRSTALLGAMMLGMSSTAIEAHGGRPDVLWSPNLGKKKNKPMKKRDTNWMRYSYEKPEVKRSHKNRNKKGRP